MKKDYEVIKRFLENPSDEEEIFESETLIFVDWREYDEDIIRYFNEKIDNKIEVKLINNGKDYGEDIILKRDSKELRIPYENNIMERDVTIKYLNEFIRPEYQIRWFLETLGNDTLGFALLSLEEWNLLEKEFANKVQDYFLEINLDSSMFNLSFEEVGKLLEIRKKKIENL